MAREVPESVDGSGVVDRPGSHPRAAQLLRVLLVLLPQRVVLGREYQRRREASQVAYMGETSGSLTWRPFPR